MTTADVPCPVLVGFCPVCRVGVEPYVRGQRCDMECDRTYIKRRFYVCRECDGYYKTPQEYGQHVHGDWEEGVL